MLALTGRVPVKIDPDSPPITDTVTAKTVKAGAFFLKGIDVWERLTSHQREIDDLRARVTRLEQAR